MCIRDRAALAAPGDAGADGVEGRGHLGDQDHVRAAGEARLCLLYTSDAADERSSVDLGGRRIIKKERREESRGRGGMTTKSGSDD